MAQLVARSTARWALRPVVRLVALSLALVAVLSVAGGWPVGTGTAGASSAGTPAAGSAAGSGPALLLDAQSPWVTPGAPTFSVSVTPTAAAGPPAGLTLVVALYDRLTSRSVFQQVLASGPTTAPIDHTAPLVLATPVPAGGDPVAVTVSTAASTSRHSPDLDLGCEPGGCAGVYPVTLTLERAGAEVTRLTTFLTYAETTSSQPLRVAWVASFSSPVASGRGSSPLSRAGASALAGQAAALAAHPAVPETVALQPSTLQALDAVPGTGPRAVQTLANLSSDPAHHEFLVQPYVPVDANALAAAGLTGELSAQVSRGLTLFSTFRVTVDPGPRTWLVTGSAGSALARALGPLGASRIILPTSDLTSADGSTPTFAQPFQLALGKAESVTAAAIDGSVAGHFAGSTRDPVLAANQLLADLALVHYEAPSPAEAPRGLVAMAPPGWAADPAFAQTLLAGLTANPNLTPVTVAGLFSTVPAGANGWPATRSVAAGPGPTVTAGLARAVATGRLRLSDFDDAVVGDPLLLGRLDDDLLAAEASGLRPGQSSAGVTRFERALGRQLSLIQLTTDQTITLTSRAATIPVTVHSAAPYTVRGTLSLSSDKLLFEPPGPVRPGVVIDRPTDAVRFAVVARTSGDLPLSVTFTSPHGTVVFAHTVLTVRSTATSVAGVVLTLAAVAVLLAWWLRTWRVRRRSRDAAAHGEAAASRPADDPALTAR
jgi:hypothetical protein